MVQNVAMHHKLLPMWATHKVDSNRADVAFSECVILHVGEGEYHGGLVSYNRKHTQEQLCVCAACMCVASLCVPL